MVETYSLVRIDALLVGYCSGRRSIRIRYYFGFVILVGTTTRSILSDLELGFLMH